MTRIAGVLVLSVSLFGCGPSGDNAAASGAESAPAPAPVSAAPAQGAAAAPKPAAPGSAAPAAVPTERVDDPSFELALLPTPPYAVGKLGSFALSLKPRGGYHINQDYPIHVALSSSDGVTLPKAELKKPDAASFGEQLARFDVPCTPAKPGQQRVEAHVKFAVCTPENCVPDERTLALVLPVE